MSEIKKQKRFVYEGFGFPIVLRNVPMVKVRGVWTPKVDYNKIAKETVEALAHKSARLTGNEIRFIRQYFEMTLESFGLRFDVSHPAVLKWERAGAKPTNMKWPIEKDIRLFILDKLGGHAKAFKGLYDELHQEINKTSKPIEMDMAKAA